MQGLALSQVRGGGSWTSGSGYPLHQKPVKGEVCVHALVLLSGSCRRAPPPLSASEDAEQRGFKFKDVLNTPSESESFRAVIGSLTTPLPSPPLSKVEECAA